MLIWLLFLSLLTTAQDNVIEEYCFSTPAKMVMVLNKTKFILIASDKVQSDKSCFTVNTLSHRRELIQNYVRRIDPTVGVSFSSLELKREHCHLKVEKIHTLQRNTKEGSIYINGDLSFSTEQQGDERKDISTIQTLKEFELFLNQDSIKGECRAITPDRYEIKIEVKKVAPPVLAPTIAEIAQDKEPTPPQEISKLSTTVQLTRGQKIELGSLVTNLKKNADQIKANSGAVMENAEGTESEKVFLYIE